MKEPGLNISQPPGAYGNCQDRGPNSYSCSWYWSRIFCPHHSHRPWGKGHHPIGKGVIETTKSYPMTTKRTVHLGTKAVTHSFLVVPDCPFLLLGCDLFWKLGAVTSFPPTGTTLSLGLAYQLLVTILLTNEYMLTPQPKGNHYPKEIELLNWWKEKYLNVCAEQGHPGLAQHHPPVIVQLLSSVRLVRVKQCPVSLQAWKWISPHICWLLEAIILTPCKYAWNTLFLPFT